MGVREQEPGVREQENDKSRPRKIRKLSLSDSLCVCQLMEAGVGMLIGDLTSYVWEMDLVPSVYMYTADGSWSGAVELGILLHMCERWIRFLLCTVLCTVHYGQPMSRFIPFVALILFDLVR